MLFVFVVLGLLFLPYQAKRLARKNVCLRNDLFLCRAVRKTLSQSHNTTDFDMMTD